MPGSMSEGKQFIKDFLLTKNIKRILDVGPGSGNYFDLLTKRGEYASYEGKAITGIEWVGLEIWEPYIHRFQLKEKYNQIIIGDIGSVDWDSLGQFDVVILGDVIEHMEEIKGKKVIREAALHSTWVILSLPIINYPQGEQYGNIHETHMEQYSSDRIKSILSEYNIIDYRDGEVIGIYIFTKP